MSQGFGTPPQTPGGDALSNLVNASTNTTAAAGDVVFVDTTSGPVTITLPTTPAALSQVVVKKVNDDSGASAVTVVAHGSGLIDRASDYVITDFNGSATFQNLAADTWKVISEVGPLSAQSGSPRRVNQGGNTGSAVTLATAGDPDVWLVNATLNAATVTVTVTGLATGAAQRVKIIGVQDATGGRVLRVNDGSGAVTVTGLPAAAGAPFEVNVDWDGTDSTAYAVGASSVSDADATTKGVVQLAGDLTGTAASPQIADGAVAITNLAAGVLDTDGTLAANSDSKLASQKAVKTYVDGHVGGGSTGPLHRRMASPNMLRGRTLSANFANQALTNAQFDLTNFTYTVDAGDSNRPCIAQTDWLALSTIIAKPGYVMGDVDTHMRLKIPTGGAHSSVDMKLFSRYVNSTNNFFTNFFSASNQVIVGENGGTVTSVTTSALAAGYWHVRYKTIGPVHFAKWWPESGDEPDWQLVTVRGDLSTGWLELGFPALAMQFAASSDGSVPVLVTDLTWTENLPAGEDVGWNGDFRINNTANGLPIGWAPVADGAHGTTTFADVTIDGASRRAAVLERTQAGGGGAGIVLNLYPRNGRHGLPRFPTTIPEWARYLEITMTHKMENIAHGGADTFLCAATSMYYDDVKSGGLNTIGGSGGGAQNDYYAGWGPTGVVGGSGSTGGLGSTGGFIRESRLMPLHPAYRTDLVIPGFVLHDPDTVGKWTITDIEFRPVA